MKKYTLTEPTKYDESDSFVIPQGSVMINCHDLEVLLPKIQGFLTMIVATGNKLPNGYLIPEAERLIDGIKLL